ncbi:Mitochondrial distribution and morphology protein 34 [Escovopsis weberi]|uniref:Mitochondrial distribution and morphology protein 34 n=1 Tax=Escovopsis weberi TaxID=150374 RepID=A0A0M8N719_ESCWE|nr:Mitochondrial distribution and morphology protein 34 [Escovopsis weberi]
MAFNFNWSPLTADADFYSRARDLLTKALNKSPKPPIIVDDILVSELNLGTVPPHLEILEIGDLAEDRFRGIFKMCYSGDAFLTLKTRVQANPLNTYLSAKPSFTSPKPLAAAAGLTIPLSITLSDIKLSAFIILVFSRQKGLTLVFRNDPLESLKVSSTFDSIQFVRDYLQRTIEQQLRNLMMDELPAIIHRLSLQLWCPDQVKQALEAPKEDADDDDEEEEEEEAVNPLANPPVDPVDANGNALDANAVSEISLNGSGEMQSLFSQKNLLRLAALTDSHRTLSLFTPGIQDVVFRAWSGCNERSELPTPSTSSLGLARTQSQPGTTSTTYTFSDSGSASHGYAPSRPSMTSLSSVPSSLGAGSNHRARPGRKKKNRVVNLRRTKSETPSADSSSDDVTDAASSRVNFAESVIHSTIPEEPEIVIDGPAEAKPTSSDAPVSEQPVEIKPANQEALFQDLCENLQTIEQLSAALQNLKDAPDAAPPARKPASEKKSLHEKPLQPQSQPQPTSSRSPSHAGSSNRVLEEAWVMKMASEIARRVYDEKRRHKQGLWEENEDAPPPAYEATAP